MSKRPSAKERREALKQRTREEAKNRDAHGGSQKAQPVSFKGKEISFYKPKEGRNRINILPYEIKTKNHPQGTEIGYDDYKLDIWVHKNVGPAEGSYICLKETFGKACPICEEKKQLEKDPKATKDEIDELKPKRRCYYNIEDDMDPDKGIQIFESSHFLFEKELLEEAETASTDIITFSDIEEGKMIEFRGTEEKGGQYTYLKFKSFKFHDREPYGEEIFDETISLDECMVIPSYNEILNAFHGVDVDEEEDEPEEKPRRRRPAPEPEEDDDYEDEVEEKPRTRRREKAEPKKSGGKCIYDHEFGVDCDKQKECATCESWDDCADEKERLDG